MPNTYEIIQRYEPAINTFESNSVNHNISRIQWNLTFAWAVIISGLFIGQMVMSGGPTEFLYFQF